MEVDTPAQKKITDQDTTTNTANGKKSKSATNVSVSDPKAPRYWLGFSYMEQIAIDRDLPECTNNEPLEDLMEKRYIKTENTKLVNYALDQVHCWGAYFCHGIGHFEKFTFLNF